jgi:hypothetical protein
MSAAQEVGEIFGDGKGPAHAMLRSPTVLIVSIGLWGMNVFFFRLFGINYISVLNYDLEKEKERDESQSKKEEDKPREGLHSRANSETETDDDDDYDELPPVERSGSAITWGKLVFFSLFLLLLLHFTTYYWIERLGRGSIGAVFSFYSVVLVYIFCPLASSQWLRKAFVIVLQRAFELLNPRCACASLDANGPRPIPFVDVFFADAMCSLSKVFFDWGMLLHMASHYPEPVPHSVHNILIPSACAAIPYFIRVGIDCFAPLADTSIAL